MQIFVAWNVEGGYFVNTTLPGLSKAMKVKDTI